jgi:hypothetical protein
MHIQIDEQGQSNFNRLATWIHRHLKNGNILLYKFWIAMPDNAFTASDKAAITKLK